MARRRGFFAEMQHQAKVAEQRQRAAERQQLAAIRRTEQARKAEQQAALRFQRASEADRKRLEKEALAAHLATQQAEVDQLNAELAASYDRLDTLLAATLNVDDYLDLESLRRPVVHPPFDRADLEIPVSAPITLLDPEPPVFQAPAAPTGLFGRKKKLAEAQAQAEAEYGVVLDARGEPDLAATAARRAAR